MVQWSQYISTHGIVVFHHFIDKFQIIPHTCIYKLLAQKVKKTVAIGNSYTFFPIKGNINGKEFI